LYVLAQEVHRVTGKEQARTPAGAALFAFCRSFQAENPAVTVRCIDMDSDTTATAVRAEIAVQAGPDLVALRAAERYTQKLTLLESVEPSINLRDGGVYLITGGVAGIGLEIARAFASAAKVRLALVSRSGADHVQAALEALGAQVAVYQADVSQAADVARVVRDIRKRWGKIDGVVHSAGVAGQGYVHGKAASDLVRVLAPKLNGVLNLERELADEQLQFFVAFSSLAAYLGIAGQSDYAAANAFLDALASRRSQAGLPGQALAWPAWSETGMAARHGVLGQSVVFAPLTNAEGVAAFWRCLASNVPHVLVGRIDAATAQGSDTPHAARKSQFEVVLPQSLNALLGSARNGAGRQRTRSNTERKVTALGIATSDRSAIEQQLATVWGKLLDLDEIDVNQNFHSLGGDSLLVTKLYRELDQLWPGRVHISDIFTSSTIAEMAKRLHQELQPAPVPKPVFGGDLDAILDQLAQGSLSVDDADAKVRSMKVGT
jgi:polyketide synthase PksN